MGGPGLQGRAVVEDQASRGRQLIRLAGEWLGGDQAGRQKQLGAIRKAGRQASSWEPAVLDWTIQGNKLFSKIRANYKPKDIFSCPSRLL